MRTTPTDPTAPLGATWDGEGTAFAVYSEHATRVELCLFNDPADATASVCTDLQRSGPVWHAYLPGVHPGQAYGYRAHGPHAPATGDRFNPSKLLLDPYTKAISGSIQWDDVLASHQERNPDPAGDLVLDTRDSAGAMAKCLVINPEFD